ncbi:MAG TPA: selenide, water dikinase SelD, partial [Bacteroidales bacterium]|nr:selenide, water dikinase SelD [Bacteroidales bacterium]
MEIYLDYNATTPVDREVAEAMKPFMEHYFGNPSSIHRFGIETKRAVEHARRQVATLINCHPHEIVFTSGGTESNNYAIKGAAWANGEKGNHLITSQIEHPAVLEVCRYLEGQGYRVTYLPVDDTGMVREEDLQEAITSRTILISIMHANNEIGTLQPIDKLARIAKDRGILFHTDAAQSTGKIPVDVRAMGLDMLSIAGHKLYAPKGIGALFIREGIKLEKMMHGADHERNQRAGTENVIEIVGLGKACEVADRDMEKNMEQMRTTRDQLHEQLSQALPPIKWNGHPADLLPNTLSISFPGIEANLLLSEIAEKGIAASAGAACHADQVDVSTVLQAIRLDEHYAMGTLRFSTGRKTTREEIDRAAQTIIKAAQALTSGNEKVQEETSGIRLTHYTQGMGCACKLRPQELEKILREIPVAEDPNILIDTRNSDDAAVYKVSQDTAIVQTLDFFTPVVDEAYDFGAIAAANALSDIYAMGAQPLFALNIVGFPSSRLPMSTLQNILLGAREKAREAGISILGGHTIEDHEPKYGMVVTGIVHPNRVLSNAGAQEGDLIILTKPIGTGILSTAVKRGLATNEQQEQLTAIMAELNRSAAQVISRFPVHACTDVTGFGLMG